ncbi:dihydrolipoyl dehydrogenase [Paenibacillus eucommiae]|uniref:Dihydrolipoyl dehydrogenase n=1 Tax=Paenibacillus eucommiae TaxID=1355755 RepID=A0ABS4J4Y3_9BACL|nr:dihydrolipoyl dehydrogenase [Paenibacillus eucommiae]MBP1993854.1 dihydrolipoamide dehydrogenase [Paenibacillus eucommiae]
MLDAQNAKLYDIVIIGGGTGGYVAAIRAAQHGKKVAIVESKLLGGTCLHQGCIPTKALLESSKLYERILHADAFGIELQGDSVHFNVEKAFLRKKSIVDQLHQGIQYLMKKNKVEVFKGKGQLAGQQGPQGQITQQAHPVEQVDPAHLSEFLIRIEAEGDTKEAQTIRASHVILATGSKPSVPPGIHVDGSRVFTSDEILSKPIKPSHITIVGSGAIGVEFACYFRGMGCAVRLVEREHRLLPLEDEEISKEIRRSFENKGIETITGCHLLFEDIKQVEPDKLEYTLRTASGEETKHSTEALLLAMGRRNNTSGLGLQSVGLNDGERYIKTNEYMQTEVSGLYAVGDIAGSFQLAHVASQQAIIAVDTICGQDIEPYQSHRVPRCTYAHPEIASIGMTEEQAKQAGYSIKIGKFPMKANGRALIHGEAEGFIKLVVDEANDMLLGAHMIGDGATELISLSSLAIFLEGTAWELGMNVYPHPTVAEIFGEAAHAVSGHAIHT